MSSFKNPAWLPFSVSEAASAGDATSHDLDTGEAWNHLLDALKRAGDVVLADTVPHGLSTGPPGSGTCSSCWVWASTSCSGAAWIGAGHQASGMDAAYKWGMECPDCIYVGSALKGG